MKNVFCSTEVILGGLLDGSWMGADHQKDQAMIKILGFFQLPPHSPERGEGLERELIMDHAHNIYGILHKIPIVGGSGSFQIGEHIHTGRMTHSNSTGTETPALGILPDLSICISSSGCSVAFIISFDRLVNVFP